MQYAHAVCVAYFTPFLLQKTSMGLIRKLVSSNIHTYVRSYTEHERIACENTFAHCHVLMAMYKSSSFFS